MDIYAALRRLYPGTQADKDYVLRDDGQGPYIERWLMDGPQPTAEELEAASSPTAEELEAGRVAGIMERLAASDAEMARIGEDILNALIGGGLLALEALPQAALDKIAARQGLRAELAQQ